MVVEYPQQDSTPDRPCGEPPLGVCLWERDCPPCYPTMPEPGQPSSCFCYLPSSDLNDQMSSYIDRFGMKNPSAGVNNRVIQFFWRAEYLIGFAIPAHSRKYYFWDSIGGLYGIHGEPTEPDPVLWSRDFPDKETLQCQGFFNSSLGASSELSCDPQPSGPVLATWMALQGHYNKLAPSSVGVLPKGCETSSDIGVSSESSDDICKCFVPVWSSANTVMCQESSWLDPYGLTQLASEVSGLFDSTGKLMKLYWGGTQHLDQNCDWVANWEQVPLTARNCLVWDRDNPPAGTAGCIVPFLDQSYEDQPETLDVGLYVFDSIGRLIRVCKILSTGQCEISEPDRDIGLCPCEEVACIRLIGGGGPFPPPDCPTTVSFGCPGAQRVQEGLCVGAESSDGLNCDYEYNSFSLIDPPTECFERPSSEISSGPGSQVKWCIYDRVTISCQ